MKVQLNLSKEVKSASYGDHRSVEDFLKGFRPSLELTDTARAALLWVLWHHQGRSSPVGQPIRFALGMGAHERLSSHQVAEAKRWAAITGSTTWEFHGHCAHHGPPEAGGRSGGEMRVVANALVDAAVRLDAEDIRRMAVISRAQQRRFGCTA